MRLLLPVLLLICCDIPAGAQYLIDTTTREKWHAFMKMHDLPIDAPVAGHHGYAFVTESQEDMVRRVITEADSGRLIIEIDSAGNPVATPPAYRRQWASERVPVPVNCSCFVKKDTLFFIIGDSWNKYQVVVGMHRNDIRGMYQSLMYDLPDEDTQQQNIFLQPVPVQLDRIAFDRKIHPGISQVYGRFAMKTAPFPFPDPFFEKGFRYMVVQQHFYFYCRPGR